MRLIESDTSSNPLIFVFERHNYKPHGLVININAPNFSIENLVELGTESEDMSIISYDINCRQRNRNKLFSHWEYRTINYKYMITNNTIKTWVDGIKTRTIKIQWDKL